jgi:replication factor C subunit 2/4
MVKKSKKKRERVSNKDLDDIVNNTNNINTKVDEQFEKAEGKMMKDYYKKNHQKLLEERENIPWIEKYRPTKIKDIVIDDSTRKKINSIIKSKDMPNIIITGIPGIGKTTTSVCIARALLGKYYNDCALESNASDERGIKPVQDKIVNFCRKMTSIEDTEDRVYAKHKIALLDEADNMTTKAQQLINTQMDEFHDTTRFIFTCNNSSGIIEAIQSRCIIFRYRRLDNNDVLNRLKHICEIEKVNYTEDGLSAIILTSQGDLRKALNNLQLTFVGYKDVTPDNVYKLCDKPHPLIIKNMFLACYKKKLKEALEHLEELIYDGYSSSDISLSMVSTLKSPILKDDIDEPTKIKFMEKVGKACLVITKGVNSPLQLTGCIASMCM